MCIWSVYEAPSVFYMTKNEDEHTVTIAYAVFIIIIGEVTRVRSATNRANPFSFMLTLDHIEGYWWFPHIFGTQGELLLIKWDKNILTKICPDIA